MAQGTDKNSGGPGVPPGESIGQRIAAIRRARGLTQHGLAQRAHISYSTVTKVESGHIAASPMVTSACARALRVPATDLTGQPYYDQLKADQLEELIQPLRQAIANPMLPPEEGDPRALAAIRADVARLDAWRLRGEYMVIAAEAPALVDELLLAADRAPAGREREKTYRALADTYRLARSLLGKLGYTDLGLLALDRMQQTIPHAGDPYLQVVVCHYRGDYFLHHGAPEIALREIGAMERMLEDPVRRGDVRAMSVRGTMWLKSAVLHSRSGRSGAAGEVTGRVSEARALAGRLAGRPDPYGLVFDEMNVQLHEASTQLDLGETGRMVELGERVRLPEGWARNRAGHHHMDMARAYEVVGQRERAVSELVAARQAAPAQTRYHPTTRETVHALLRKRRSPEPALQAVARWVGV
ncbi:helix-turn-helix domain-containing protein [Streptomyces sp. ST2-7A]|uniref:helix-turn-helix domain-containing protein n=1 Tax=Streptomyces sp. ST2-7A TaxID=2907214 RepID=UPI001F2426CC|nr:helix-turn-helix transcriptional regulator [Streptomyces sp. ST2-7A]MCE7081130.1 helix-turn-helix transcriptional regulator [Streptomyces sp. ST2-7A]